MAIHQMPSVEDQALAQKAKEFMKSPSFANQYMQGLNSFDPTLGIGPGFGTGVGAGVHPGGGGSQMGNYGPYDPASMGDYNVANASSYIQDAAQRYGIDPNIAMRVAQSEGLGEGIWQSNFSRNGVREPSFGPFQLLVGGGNYPTQGMGNQMIRETGVDPRDPRNWQAGIDFALGQAARHGWGQWYGAAKSGIGDWQGIPRRG